MWHDVCDARDTVRILACRLRARPALKSSWKASSDFRYRRILARVPKTSSRNLDIWPYNCPPRHPTSRIRSAGFHYKTDIPVPVVEDIPSLPPEVGWLERRKDCESRCAILSMTASGIDLQTRGDQSNAIRTSCRRGPISLTGRLSRNPSLILPRLGYGPQVTTRIERRIISRTFGSIQQESDETPGNSAANAPGYQGDLLDPKLRSGYFGIA
jgi:hypothetical protein